MISYKYENFKNWIDENIYIICFCFVPLSLFLVIINELLGFIVNIDSIFLIFSFGFIFGFYLIKVFFSLKKSKQVNMVIKLYLSRENYEFNQLEDFLEDKNIKFLTKFSLLLHVLMPLPIFFSTRYINLKRSVNLFTFVFYLFCLLFSILIHISGVIA